MSRPDLQVNPKAIIIGASSGIGAALAVELDAVGYVMGLAARRRELLDQVAASLKSPSFTKIVDLRDVEYAMSQLRSLIHDMDGVDLFVISSGVGFENPALTWAPEEDTIAVNVMGFASVANVAVEHLASRGHGHLVGISSIAAIRGHGDAPAYGASKAFVSSYLQSLRHRFAKRKLPICVTEIQPGFVDTAMAKGEGLFWVATAQSAACDIMWAIRSRRSHAYVTARWRLIAWFLRLVPDWVYSRI